MTQEQAYNRLQNEPDYLVSVMVANNLKRLNERAQQMNLASADLSADAMFALFNRLALAEDYIKINQLINGVEYAPNTLTKGNDKFFFENFSPLMNEAFVGPPTDQEFWDQYGNTENGDWWTDFDWGGVVDSLGGVIQIFSNWGDDGEETFTPPASTPTNNISNSSNSNGANGNIFSNENIKTYGPWVLVLVLVAWMAYRKKL